MIPNTLHEIVGSSPARGQRGGVALIMLIAFMVLAIPMVAAANQVTDQLVRSSMVYDERMAAAYNAESGFELSVSKILEDIPSFTGLNEGDSVAVAPFSLNGTEVTSTITLVQAGNPAADGGLADIVLVLDNSGSISQDCDECLADLKDGANAIVDGFNPGGSEGRVRLGVVRFEAT